MEKFQNQPAMGNFYQIQAEDLRGLIFAAVAEALEGKTAPPSLPDAARVEWGSRHDASVIASVSLPTIHALIGQGLIEARKVGRRTLINLSDLREKLASGEISRYHKNQKQVK